MPTTGPYALDAVGYGRLAASADQSAVPIASISKVVTALVILDAHPLAAGEAGPDIAYTQADVDVYWDVIRRNGTNAPVVAGSTLSQRDSLIAMLLPSANNYAISLATWAFGSVEGFSAAARTWLDAHGFANTNLVEPSGLSAENVSTPGELVQIGELALEQPAIAEIVRMTSADLPVVGHVENTNELLGHGGVDGIKTGTTEEAGACLLFSTDVIVGTESITVVGVVLGGPDHDAIDAQIAALLASATTGFHEITALEANTVLAEYTTPWGESARARAASSVSLVVWGDTSVDVSVSADPLALATRGEQAGTATVTTSAGTVVEVPLVLDAAIEDPGSWWRLTNPGALEG
nr:D-alanyl-D-alanine carboxypeptidase [Agromyces seonyuensis]